MKFSVTLLAVAPALFGLVVAVAQGCGSTAQQTVDGDQGSLTGSPAGQGGSGSGTGGSGSSMTPAPGTVINCNPALVGTLGPVHEDCAGVNLDMSCSTADSSTGSPCTRNCYVQCGFEGMGLKTCTCAGGVYESCPCPRPDNYLGATSATFCTMGDGLEDTYDETPCTTEWEQCITKDATTSTPRGCVCLGDGNGGLAWACGSTNNWFSLETGGATAVCQGAMPDPKCAGINPDLNCNSSRARSGESCTTDCLVPCGYQTMGLKTCSCAQGTYSQCPCPKPDEYLGAPTAPDCSTMDSPDGSADALDDLPCTVEWAQCIGNDRVDGNTPRGCACMKHIVTGNLQWFCGSTNRWFIPG
jgi:hypothetical protein